MPADSGESADFGDKTVMAPFNCCLETLEPMDWLVSSSLDLAKNQQSFYSLGGPSPPRQIQPMQSISAARQRV